MKPDLEAILRRQHHQSQSILVAHLRTGPLGKHHYEQVGEQVHLTRLHDRLLVGVEEPENAIEKVKAQWPHAPG